MVMNGQVASGLGSRRSPERYNVSTGSIHKFGALVSYVCFITFIGLSNLLSKFQEFLQKSGMLMASSNVLVLI